MTDISQPFFSMEEHFSIFICRGIPTCESTRTMLLNVALNANRLPSPQKKEAVGCAWRVLQSCQLPEKKFPRCSRGIWKFSLCFKIRSFYYYSTISCRTPDNFLQNPGWETLDLTTGWVAEESGFDLQQGQRHVSSPQHPDGIWDSHNLLSTMHCGNYIG